ncbi:MAG: MerR family transcriptional regulator, partial [Treponemataceae bacterium]|nr:MerR family transcriptional regulator [Treponemataceae bacterium]
MLKIGDFSKLSRITVRMLRHYDEIDLLKPQSVDEWTGYRHYDEAQLIAANKIRLLKHLGFGLSAIKEMLAHFDYDDEIRNLLIIRRTELV